MSCHLETSIIDDLGNPREEAIEKLNEFEARLSFVDTESQRFSEEREFLIGRIYWHREFLGMPQTRVSAGYFNPRRARVSSEAKRQVAELIDAIVAMVTRMLIMMAMTQRVRAERASR